MLRLLVVNRLLDPGSEFHVHRQWYVDSAMDELLETDFSVAEKDRLYRCLDRVLEHKQELFVFLKQKWAELFAADFEVLLYDLTSTYFEGEMEQNPKARRGYSRDGRPAVGDRVGGHSGWIPAGVRSLERQHGGLLDAAGFSEENRNHVWPGAPGVGDGSRHSQ